MLPIFSPSRIIYFGQRSEKDSSFSSKSDRYNNDGNPTGRCCRNPLEQQRFFHAIHFAQCLAPRIAWLSDCILESLLCLFAPPADGPETHLTLGHDSNDDVLRRNELDLSYSDFKWIASQHHLASESRTSVGHDRRSIAFSRANRHPRLGNADNLRCWRPLHCHHGVFV